MHTEIKFCLDKRAFPEAYRQLRKDRFDSLRRWKSEGGAITSL